MRKRTLVTAPPPVRAGEPTYGVTDPLWSKGGRRFESIVEREAYERTQVASSEPPTVPTRDELTEVHEAHRKFKLAILASLGLTDPWAITVENERRICERITALRATVARLAGPVTTMEAARVMHECRTGDPRVALTDFLAARRAEHGGDATSSGESK